MVTHKDKKAPDRYLLPTSAGALYALQSLSADSVAQYLRFLLSQKVTPLFNRTELKNKLSDDSKIAEEAISRMQQKKLLRTLSMPVTTPDDSLEDILPRLLSRIVASGEAILSDEQGFYLSRSGFTHEAAEELSALGANLQATNNRYHKLLDNNLGIKSTAWAIIDPAGKSEISFWPLCFPRDRFTLILSGTPQLSAIEFTILVSCLAIRYND